MKSLYIHRHNWPEELQHRRHSQVSSSWSPQPRRQQTENNRTHASNIHVYTNQINADDDETTVDDEDHRGLGKEDHVTLSPPIELLGVRTGGESIGIDWAMDRLDQFG